MKPASVIGVSITRAEPNSLSRPLVILYAPSYCATSSPITKTFKTSAAFKSAITKRWGAKAKSPNKAKCVDHLAAHKG